MLPADREQAIIGSIDLTSGSFDSRRDRGVIRRVWRVAHEDWENSHALDLSEEGVREDLERYANAGGVEPAQ